MIVVRDWKAKIAEYLVEVESYYNAELFDNALYVYEHAVKAADYYDPNFELPPFPTAVSHEMERQYEVIYASRTAAIKRVLQNSIPETDVVVFQIVEKANEVYAERVGIYE